MLYNTKPIKMNNARESNDTGLRKYSHAKYPDLHLKYNRYYVPR